MNYPGGKNGAGTYQTIINQMPPHAVYVEAFLGSGAILRHKLPAPEANIGIDVDANALALFQSHCDGAIPKLKLENANALEYLASWHFEPSVLIYLDPPYLMATRRTKRPLYRHEMHTEAEHRQLLEIAKRLDCMVMVSGYQSDLYAALLKGWRVVTYQSQTRGGKPALEYLWMNYQEPMALHDYRYLGQNYRERERIKRQQTRWRERLKRMPALERYAILSQLDAIRQPGNVITPP